jgi:uncharacterized protein YndB with AHSA1/START domain
MSITSIDKDVDTLTLTVVAEFAAPVERVWQLWADPRQLERWWGPPTYPATVEEHDLTPGGSVTYVMTGPGGEKSRGWWRVVAVDPPTSLEVVDGFANADGSPNTDMPTIGMTVRLVGQDGGTRMEMRSIFDSREQMDELAAMGMEEGLRESVGQIDAILAA